jgi:hypothetical protein
MDPLASHSLNKTRSQLVAMVQRQRDKWPKDPKRKFNASKTRHAVLKATLLNASFGFTLPNEPTATGSGGASPSQTGMGMGEGTAGLGNDNQAEGSGLVCLHIF